jgi:hypothetical protein
MDAATDTIQAVSRPAAFVLIGYFLSRRDSRG